MSCTCTKSREVVTGDVLTPCFGVMKRMPEAPG